MGNSSISIGYGVETKDFNPQLFNVTAYGAVGDGTHDDSDAIQAAVDAASAVNGTVNFNGGQTYKLTKKISFTKVIGLVGDNSSINVDADVTAFEANYAAYNRGEGKTGLRIESLNLRILNTQTASVIKIIGTDYMVANQIFRDVHIRNDSWEEPYYATCIGIEINMTKVNLGYIYANWDGITTFGVAYPVKFTGLGFYNANCFRKTDFRSFKKGLWVESGGEFSGNYLQGQFGDVAGGTNTGYLVETVPSAHNFINFQYWRDSAGTSTGFNLSSSTYDNFISGDWDCDNYVDSGTNNHYIGFSRNDGVTIRQALGIGGLADLSAVVDFKSTTRGFRPPCMTTAQRDAIASPVEGLIIYNTTTHSLNIRTNAAWKAVTFDA